MSEPECYSEAPRRARKEHTCECWCGLPISRGERYIEIRGLWDHEWDTLRAHEHCLALHARIRELLGQPEEFPFRATYTYAAEYAEELAR